MSQSQTPRKREKFRHPYADAQYRVYRLDDGTFGIEVTIPDALPTKITCFPSRAAATQWLESHKKTIEKQPMFGQRLWPKQTERGVKHG